MNDNYEPFREMYWEECKLRYPNKPIAAYFERFDMLPQKAIREISNDDDEVYRNEYWKECKRIFPRYPETIYFKRFDRLPMEAIMDGYDDTDAYPKEDEALISSYQSFEEEACEDEPLDDVMRNVAVGKAFVANNLYINKNGPHTERTVNRVTIDWNNGFSQNMVLGAVGTNRELLGDRELDWMSPPEAHMGMDEKGREIQLFVPKIYANSVADLAFPSNFHGTSSYFFTSRNQFTDEFADSEFSMANAMAFDSKLNPSAIGYSINVDKVQSFDNIAQYCQATGLMFADIMAICTSLVWFSHTIINIMMPKQIVLIMDSYKGVDIPVRDYIPNVAKPFDNIPDYKNRLDYLIKTMKDIATKRYITDGFPMLNGGFYIKLSLTPAIMVLKFVAHEFQQFQLNLVMPLVDNALLYDAEDVNSIYPKRFMYEENPYWYRGRNHDNADDVIHTMRNNVHTQKLGLQGGELEEFVKTHHINIYGDDTFPDTVDTSELNVDSPKDLKYYAQSNGDYILTPPNMMWGIGGGFNGFQPQPEPQILMTGTPPESPSQIIQPSKPLPKINPIISK